MIWLKNEDVKETATNKIIQSKEVKDALNTIKNEVESDRIIVYILYSNLY